MQENSRQLSRQSSVDSIGSEQNYDMVTGDKVWTKTGPEFLTGLSFLTMQSRDPLQR